MLHRIGNAYLPTPLKRIDPELIFGLTFRVKQLKTPIRGEKPGFALKSSYFLQEAITQDPKKPPWPGEKTPQDTDRFFRSTHELAVDPDPKLTKCRNPIQYMVCFSKPLVVLNNDL